MKWIFFIVFLSCFSSNPYERKLTPDNIDQTYNEIQDQGTEEEKLRSEKIKRIMEIKALKGQSYTELMSGKSFSEHVEDFRNRKN